MLTWPSSPLTEELKVAKRVSKEPWQREYKSDNSELIVEWQWVSVAEAGWMNQAELEE
jgi:hypothetical protein